MSNLFDAIECFGAVFSLVPVSALALGTLPKDKIADAAGSSQSFKMRYRFQVYIPCGKLYNKTFTRV